MYKNLVCNVIYRKSNSCIKYHKQYFVFEFAFYVFSFYSLTIYRFHIIPVVFNNVKVHKGKLGSFIY